MYEAAEQMGEDMPIGLRGNFEYRGARERVRFEKMEGTDQSGEGNDRGDHGGVTVAEQGKGEDQLEARNIGTRVVSSLGGEIESNVKIELAEGGWSTNEHSRTKTQQKLDRLRVEYAILSSVKLKAPIEDEKPSTPLLGWVTLCVDMLKSGVAALISLFARVDESARCSPPPNESKRVQDHGKCPSVVAASTQVKADHKLDVALLSVEDEFVPVEFDRVELSATEQEQVNQVLALPSTKRAADRLLASEGLISSAGQANEDGQEGFVWWVGWEFAVSSGRGLSHMSMAQSQETSVATTPARGAQKRRADEQRPWDTCKRRVEEELRRESEMRQVSSSTPEASRRTIVDPVSGPLEPWVDGEVVVSSYQEAIMWVLKVEVVEGLFIEAMGHSGMTLATLEDEMKVKPIGRLKPLPQCCSPAMMTGVKDYTELAEYQEKLATSSLDWSFLGENAEDA
ncbi:hypothetical protein GBA52_015256 [Prunus armeniaca]|nr:hypothetical protein GBA52_015256 [Prunus armeniaca]